MRIFVLSFLLIFAFSSCSASTVSDADKKQYEKIKTLSTQLDAEKDPAKKSELYNQRGNAYSKVKEYTKSRKDYVSALKIIPDSYLYTHNLAVLYEDNGETEKAIEQYQNMYKSKVLGLPEKAEAVDKMVILNLRLKKIPEAEKALDTFAAEWAFNQQAKNLVVELRGNIDRVKQDQKEISQ